MLDVTIMKFVRSLSALVPCWFALMLVAGLGDPGFAYAQVETASGAEAVREGSRPASFGSNRVEVRDEYQNLQDGSSIYMIVPRVDFSASPDVSFRIEAPVVVSDSGLPGGDTESGLGDLLFRASYRVARGTGYALVAGGELILNTAAKDALGTGKNVIAPLVFASIDLPRYDSVVFPLLQQYLTLGGDDERADVHYTSIKSTLLTRWPDLIYTILEPQVVVDYVGANKVGMTLEGEFGRFLNRNTAVWVRPGIGLFGDNLAEVYNWKFEIGARVFLK
jgi:hypothetical protein